jgi:O-antigen biosynthesis protein WbqV
MIALAGLKPDEDVDINFIGMRPGERLFEKYFDDDESTATSATPGVLVASPRVLDPTKLISLFDQLCLAAEAGDEVRVRSLLSEVVPHGAAGRRDAERPVVLKKTADAVPADAQR